MMASTACIRFIKGFEACRLQPYRDEGGKWTVGWGHLMQDGDDTTRPITQAEADALFETELMHFEEEVTQAVAAVELRQHEFDALVSFAYNCGHEALEKSTLLKNVLAGEFARAGCEYTKWVNVAGKPSLGLYRRRCAEQAMFLLADYSRGVGA
jgi:lysozyme